MENGIIKVEQTNIAQIEIDTQIATARLYPRDVKKIIQSVKDLCTINDEIAASCFYAKPVGQNKIDKNRKKIIINQSSDQLESEKIVVGESIHFAKVIASEWEHLKIRTFIKEENEKAVIAVCQIHDQQKNTAYESEVHRSIVTRTGKQSQAQIEVTKMAAQAIAFRNAVLSVIPKAYFIDTLEYIKKFSIGLGEKTKESQENAFIEAKNKAIAYFTKQGISVEKICNALSISNIDEITSDHLISLRGFVTAIKDKTETLETIFSPEPEQKDEDKTDHFE